MINENESIESFNWWQMLAIVLAFVVFALMPYVAWIGKLIFS